MPARPLNLLVLLVVGMAVAALRPACPVPYGHGLGEVHAHDGAVVRHHGHHHGRLGHGRPHHHHPGEPQEAGSDDHGCDIDHCLEAPKPRWVAPRLTGTNAPRPVPTQPGLVAPMSSGLLLARRSGPPVPTHAQHLIPLRTVVLRL